jgi:polyisoprenyl-phosphate glycosyltransferase
MISLVIPVYRNSANIPDLLAALEQLNEQLRGGLELVFVVDGSPDDSLQQLAERLPRAGFRSQLLSLSRNFGAFAAIRAGLEAAQGPHFAVMAADLQEPPELILSFDRLLRTGDCDVVVGRRIARGDPLSTRMFSATFWGFYRRFVQREIPSGGVDVFGCTATVRDQIVAMQENNSSLVGLLFWIGFRRAEVPYERRERVEGTSAWTFAKKLKYLSDSMFSFSDLPIKMLYYTGAAGLLLSIGLGLLVVWAKLLGEIPVPGYTATVLIVMFFGALNCYGIGILGGYVWRTFENTKGRPNYIVASRQAYRPLERDAAERKSGAEAAKDLVSS